ncbi:hypothetical protein [Qingshengfaniella alkalisoli]|uniref:Uncharacterized protein n=1 Tax=Qingshengfaniella alkalisoli TaxID=2599296 RepID=A0A5B8IT15_9RHOB|nr:hypothetical protein [Qingshengfaniella alkalisoli]QDY68764.1 hypothetical protein FPZ52_03395 [Qingshengfaniella alkalisoli]
MTLQNRVLPTGEIVADPVRGTVMGNRGILHSDDRTLRTARWTHPHWIICRLDFKNRRREVMAPQRYTELFFYDEAVALSAGHRPCAECRRGAYNRFLECWAVAFGNKPSADKMDRTLHHARVQSRTRRQIIHEADIESLPTGVFIAHGETVGVIRARHFVPFIGPGYGAPKPVPAGRAVVLTPAPTVAVLKAGYRPDIRA